MAIAEYSRKAGFLHQPLDQLCRKAGLRPREITPVEADRNAGDFPMSRWGVLASGLFTGASKMQRRAAAGPHAGKLTPGRQLAGCRQTEFDQIGNMQRPSARMAVGLSRNASL